jgi:hypothetical protein
VTKTITLATVSCCLALACGAASASEHHGHRARVAVTMADSADAALYYPGWGREPVVVRGVYPGLVYGGATSAPAGRR